MEFHRVERPVFSPTRCFLCHRVDTPMVDCKVNLVGVGTYEGLRDIPGQVYICIGDDFNPGCVPQMARLAGMVPAEALADSERYVGDLRAEAEQAQLRIAELEEAQPKVVSLAEAEELVAAAVTKAKPKVPARPRR